MPRPLRITVPSGQQYATERAGELAERQWWAIARRQLLAEGMGPELIRTGLRLGRLHRTDYPGVYVWGRPDLPEKGQLSAGLLYAGMGSALDGVSALWWQKILSDRPDLIHIASPRRTSSRADLLIRHPRRIDRHLHDDELPVVDLASALLAATPYLDDRGLRIASANADFHDLLHLPSLQSALRSGPPGSKALRKAMALHLPQLARCANDFEIDFVLLCEANALPIPEPNVMKGRYVPDMTWESRKLIVELDGKGNHSSAAQRTYDKGRQAWLEALGYTVIRFSWAEVYFQQAYVVRRLLAYLRP